MTDDDRELLKQFAVGNYTAYELHHAQNAVGRLLAELDALDDDADYVVPPPIVGPTIQARITETRLAPVYQIEED